MQKYNKLNLNAKKSNDLLLSRKVECISPILLQNCYGRRRITICWKSKLFGCNNRSEIHIELQIHRKIRTHFNYNFENTFSVESIRSEFN